MTFAQSKKILDLFIYFGKIDKQFDVAEVVYQRHGKTIRVLQVAEQGRSKICRRLLRFQPDS